MKNISILFPGQGSQSQGMGLPWKDTKSWDLTTQAQEITGINFDELLTQKNDLLTKTEFAQLAILVNSLIAWNEVKNTDLISNSNIQYFAGHSLGQVTALIASGVFSFEEGLKFAQIRAEETQKCANSNDGAMAAFIGGSIEDANHLCEQFSNLWIANDNCLGQIVLAGNEPDVDKATTIAKEYGFKIAKKIPVDGAFHTPHMNEAAVKLKEYLENAKLSEGNTPVISNDDAKAYTDPSVWKEKLSNHVKSTVQWTNTMNFLSSETDINYEVGSGKILSGLAKRHKPEINIVPITQLEDIQK